MSHRRSEPAGLCGLRKQVTEEKEGPLEHRRKKAKAWPMKEERGRKDRVCEREKERVSTASFVLRAFIWRSQGRISIEYSSAFQVCPFRVTVSPDWPARGQRVSR